MKGKQPRAETRMTAKKKCCLPGKRNLLFVCAPEPSTPPQKALNANHLYLHLLLLRLKPTPLPSRTMGCMLNISTLFFFFWQVFSQWSFTAFSCAPGGLLSVHVHRYAEKVFVFVPQRVKLEPIKKPDFLLILLFYAFLGGIMEKFLPWRHTNSIKKPT